jgi:hypothetical protein
MNSEGGIMHNYDFGNFGGSGRQSAYGEPENGGTRKQSVFSLVVMIAVVAIIAVLALAAVFWVLGLLFHIAGLIVKVAILAAVAAVVWRWVSRHRAHDRI